MPLPNTWKFEAIGTHWSIGSLEPFDGAIKNLLLEYVEQFDQAYSRFRDDSIVSRLAREGGIYTFDPKLGFSKLFALYEQLNNRTDRAVTPLVADSLVHAGYDASYSLRQVSDYVRPQSLHDEVEWSGGDTITLKRPALLDFGALGKGLLVDELSRILHSSGISEFVIDASGDILHQATKEYVVGLEDPNDVSNIIGSLTIQGEALCSSATNRRKWGDFHHVIDGRTGKPTNDFIASWVIAEDCMTADGLATALFFSQSPDRLAADYGAGYLRIHQTGTIEMNELMKARVKLFTSSA